MTHQFTRDSCLGFRICVPAERAHKHQTIMDGATKGVLTCCGLVGLLLTIILVPLSFSYVEYYEYGLAKRKSTGSVRTDRVYPRGRYSLGPDMTFLKYQADSHHKDDSFLVFSAGAGEDSVGLEFRVQVRRTHHAVCSFLTIVD